MTSLGALTVSLEANMAQFNRGMNEAATRTEQAGQRMDSAVSMAKNAIIALGSAATVGAFAALVKGAIDAADNLRDMSQKTGIAVEELSGLGFAASQAGGSLDSMVGAAGKLNKSISEAARGNGDARDAFKALGISVVDASGNLKKADEVMSEVADQFVKYQDGPAKAALALALFGKAGADMIPFLNDGGKAMRENTAYAKQYSNQTRELSDASDNFNDTMGKLEIQQRGLSNAIAAQVLPVLQQFATSLLGAAEESRKFEAAAGLIGKAVRGLALDVEGTTSDFKRMGAVIGGIAEVNAAFYSEGIAGARRAREKINTELGEINAAQNKFRDNIKNGGPTQNPIEQFITKYSKAIADEKTLLETRMQMLKKYRGEEGFSDKEYNAGKKAAYDESLKNTRTYYDAQIAALMAMRATKQGDPLAIQAQIDELTAKKSLVGADKPFAPRLPGKKEGQSTHEKDLEEGAKLVAKLREQAESYGLAGTALLEYQLAGKDFTDSQKSQALAHQQNIDAMKAEDEANKKGAESMRKFVADHMQAQKENAAAVAQIRSSQMSQPEREQVEHELILGQLQVFHDSKLANVMQANAMIEAENARHEQVKADMRMQTDQMMLSTADDAAGQFYDMLKKAGAEQSALGKAAFLASKAIAVAQIIMSTNVAAAKAQEQGGMFGTPAAIAIRVAGYASAALTAGLAIASAEDGYDIPAGHNPVTQLHEQEMVLPKAQANVIRDLATGGRGVKGGLDYSPVMHFHIDSRTDQAQVQQLVSRAVRDGNADLVDRLQRAGRI